MRAVRTEVLNIFHGAIRGAIAATEIPAVVTVLTVKQEVISHLSNYRVSFLTH